MPVIVMTLPSMVAGPEAMLKVTGRPEDAVALTLKGASLIRLLVREPNVIVWVARLTVNDRFTLGAGAYVLSPACEARTVTVPVPVIVTRLPSMVAGPEAMLKVTGRPEDAVALTANGGSSIRLLVRVGNVIVWTA